MYWTLKARSFKISRHFNNRSVIFILSQMINIRSICYHKYLRLSYLKKFVLFIASSYFLFICHILLCINKNENFIKITVTFSPISRARSVVFLTSSVAIRKKKNIWKSAPSLKLISMPLFPLTNLKQCPKEESELNHRALVLFFLFRSRFKLSRSNYVPNYPCSLTL